MSSTLTSSYPRNMISFTKADMSACRVRVARRSGFVGAMRFMLSAEQDSENVQYQTKHRRAPATHELRLLRSFRAP
jgi:hypothetical protein